jgi:hypothetical protein
VLLPDDHRIVAERRLFSFSDGLAIEESCSFVYVPVRTAAVQSLLLRSTYNYTDLLSWSLIVFSSVAHFFEY